MIATLFNIPRAPEDLQQFSFHNADAHATAARLLFQTKGIELVGYLLDPIPLNDFPSWLRTHQTAHNAVNLLLGVQGNDLTDLDPTDEAQLTDWIQIHASEHVQWGQALRYG